MFKISALNHSMTEFRWIDRFRMKYIERRPFFFYWGFFNDTKDFAELKIAALVSFRYWRFVRSKNLSDFKFLTPSNIFHRSLIVFTNFVVNLWVSSQSHDTVCESVVNLMTQFLFQDNTYLRFFYLVISMNIFSLTPRRYRLSDIYLILYFIDFKIQFLQL